MMRNLFCIFLFLVLFIGSIYGENFTFQVIYKDNVDRYYVAHSEVILLDLIGRREIFKGYTDKYGRITIRLNPASFRGFTTLSLPAKVRYREKLWLAYFIFDFENNETRRKVLLEKVIDVSKNKKSK